MDPAATGRRVSYLPCCCYLSLLLPLLLLLLCGVSFNTIPVVLLMREIRIKNSDFFKYRSFTHKHEANGAIGTC